MISPGFIFFGCWSESGSGHWSKSSSPQITRETFLGLIGGELGMQRHSGLGSGGGKAPCPAGNSPFVAAGSPGQSRRRGPAASSAQAPTARRRLPGRLWKGCAPPSAEKGRRKEPLPGRAWTSQRFSPPPLKTTGFFFLFLFFKYDLCLFITNMFVVVIWRAPHFHQC